MNFGSFSNFENAVQARKRLKKYTSENFLKAMKMKKNA